MMRAKLIPLSLALLIAGCGGGGDDAPEPEPPPNPPIIAPLPKPARPLPEPVKHALTVMAGSAELTGQPCIPTGWKNRPSRHQTIDWDAMRFHALERFYTFGGSVYFLEDPGAEYCFRLGSYVTWGVDRMDRVGLVYQFIERGLQLVDPEIHAAKSRGSGLFWSPAGLYVLTVMDTNADRGYRFEPGYAASYRRYSYYGPSLYFYPWSRSPWEPNQWWAARWRNMPEGVGPDQPIVFDAVDGPISQARFYAPHSVVTGGDGLHYFVDKGRVRTIDGQLDVRTLHVASMAAGDVALDLDVDAQGRVHLVTQGPSGAYAWHQLHSGQRRDFRIEGYGNPHVSMAVKADGQDAALMLAVRDDALEGKWSSVYRIDGAASSAANSVASAVRVLGGEAIPAVAADYLQAPATYRLPNVRDIHFVGDALWLSVGQAALAIVLE